MLSGKCLHEIFEDRAREHPGRIAVSAAGREITYAELDSRADRLAARLRAQGVGPEVVVGLGADRGVELVVGLLAILKAGGAYLPIDPAYPEERIRFLLADGGASVVVTVSGVAPVLASAAATLVAVDEDGASPPARPMEPPAENATDHSLAYVIYTSGSTGKPKGVLIEHRNVVRLFEETRALFHFGADDVWSVFHSISFDFSVWEVWGALLFGGRLVMVPSEVARSPQRFHSLLAEQGVTFLSQTPSAFYQLVAADRMSPARLGSLRSVVLGGEALDVALLRPWIDRYGDERPALVNMYGITETTVHVTHRRLRKQDLDSPGPSPIGEPLADLEVSLLGVDGRPAPEGMPGDLHVSGPGLARGYLNRPRLTAERFLPAAIQGLWGARVYRSGDRAVRLPDTSLAYLGRLDGQFKVRGFRIEPAEVEACLAAHPLVERAVVSATDHGEGDVRLLAHLLPRSGVALTSAGAEELVAQLSRRAGEELPRHMQPSEYRIVAEIPLTAHGKLDHDALLRLAAVARPARPTADPLTETQRTLVGIVEAVLRLPEVGLGDDLFDLGATSLAFVRVLRLTNETFGVSLNGSELGDEATVARLAHCVEAELESARNHPAENTHVGYPHGVEIQP